MEPFFAKAPRFFLPFFGVVAECAITFELLYGFGVVVVAVGNGFVDGVVCCIGAFCRLARRSRFMLSRFCKIALALSLVLVSRAW